MADAPIPIRDATGELVLVDNEAATNEQGQAVRRQLVGAPDLEGHLHAIHLELGTLQARKGLPNPTTGADRVEVVSGTVTTVTTVTTVSTVTTVGSVTNIAGIGGNNPLAMPLGPFWQLAAEQRKKITVT
jgi:hypothetical protein